jgi:hypothetical protein
MNRFQRIGIISAAALAFAAPAFACSIMPPPPPPPAAAGTPQADVDALAMAWGKAHGLKYSEEMRDWAMRRQTGLFDDAKSLVLVRYDREDTTNDEKLAILRPIRWLTGIAAFRSLKGSGVSAELKLGSSMPPPCGQMIGHDAFYAKPGDVFLVYLSGDEVRAQDVLEAYSLDRIIEPRTIAALTKGPQ